jgi:hypothetical protein
MVSEYRTGWNEACLAIQRRCEVLLNVTAENPKYALKAGVEWARDIAVSLGRTPGADRTVEAGGGSDAYRWKPRTEHQSAEGVRGTSAQGVQQGEGGEDIQRQLQRDDQSPGRQAPQAEVMDGWCLGPPDHKPHEWNDYYSKQTWYCRGDRSRHGDPWTALRYAEAKIRERHNEIRIRAPGPVVSIGEQPS